MKTDALTKTLLTAIVLLLAMLAWRPLANPTPVYAQPGEVSHLYIEPGTTLLRAPDGTQNVMGKVVIDLRTGKVWGFPTLTDKPYPIDTVHSAPPVSRPLYLGRMDLTGITN